jgi:hypothetical protein
MIRGIIGVVIAAIVIISRSGADMDDDPASAVAVAGVGLAGKGDERGRRCGGARCGPSGTGSG